MPRCFKEDFVSYSPDAMQHEHDKHSKHYLSFEEVTNRAKEMLLTEGRHIPTLIIEGEQETTGILVEDMPNTHELRMLLFFRVGFAAAQYRSLGALHQVFFVSEAWMNIGEGENLPELPPSEDPKRREVLLISSFRFSDIRIQGTVIEMLRDEQGILRELRPFASGLSSNEQAESPLLRAFAVGYEEGSFWATDADDTFPLMQ